ncbi:CAP domain-containing protein [Virgibacillus xinjiangensis]|uniref:CAP domain-containing protein n=1 Tax=Virgibacillus xinjiangensis TaxID=393090 RepID=A0ABV7CXZ5_9BACI
MFKKLSVVTALSTALLFSGAFTSTADAFSKEGQNAGNNHKIYYSVNYLGGNFSESDMNKVVDKALSQLNIDWNQIDWEKIFKEGNKQEDKPEHSEETPAPEQPAEEKEEPAEQEPKEPAQEEQPQAEKPEQPKEEQPKPEQNEQPEQKEEQPKNEQPEQKEEQPQPEQAEEQVEQPEAPAPQQPASEQQEQTPTASQELNQFEQEVVELTNQERAKQGLSPLKIDTELSKVAREKSRDMATSNYFAHNSPNYGSPFDMMKSFGIEYRTAGENIAKGQRTPEEVVNGWMNSEGHRANILNADYTHIGVGYVEDGNHWTQQFIGK